MAKHPSRLSGQHVNYCQLKQTSRFEYYLSNFQEAANKLAAYINQPNHTMSRAVVGDFSPDTFFKWFIADEYIASKQGKLPLLSDYSMKHGKSLTPEVFHVAVTNSIKEWTKCASLHSELECVNAPIEWTALNLTRIHVGLYHIYLKEWLRVFPRDQFHIVKHEEYARNRDPVVKSILDFLDLHCDEEGRFLEARTDSIQLKKKYPDMLLKTRRLLQDFFKPHNEKLAKILNDNYFHWNSTYIK
ncbi:hypothetical protein ScPMuIL_005545 [Solemya velum]